MIWIILLVLIIIGLPQLVGFILSAPGYNGPKSDHFDGRYFRNISGAKVRGFRDLIKWRLNTDQGPWRELDFIKEYPRMDETISDPAWTITFINHATFLIQMESLNILTDPIWSDRTSPVSFAGPRRMAPTGLRFEDLPAVDLVLISHNHYDHLDVQTIKRLIKVHSPPFYAPLGVSRFLKKLGVEKSTDLDWWEETRVHENLELACVPAQHFSGRGTFDRNKTLWAGYVIKTKRGNLYYAGDSGYGAFFKEIGTIHGPMELSMIPIGAYKPVWFMSPIHVSPFEAVQIHKDVRSKKSVAMHFGTFPLGDDGMQDPVEDLKRALAKENIRENDFLTLDNGGQYVVEKSKMY